MIDYIKLKFSQLWNILSGKDKNWDGSVDIKDKMIEAQKERHKLVDEQNKLEEEKRLLEKKILVEERKLREKQKERKKAFEKEQKLKKLAERKKLK